MQDAKTRKRRMIKIGKEAIRRIRRRSLKISEEWPAGKGIDGFESTRFSNTFSKKHRRTIRRKNSVIHPTLFGIGMTYRRGFFRTMASSVFYISGKG